MSTLRTPVGVQDYAQGPADAPVTVVEYGDYECPYCGAAFPVVKQLQQRFGDRLRLVFREFPLTKAHENAMDAACVATFAGEHGKYWEAHDQLFHHQAVLGWPLYERIAHDLGLDVDVLRETLETERLRPAVRQSFTDGLRSGVNATPTFFVNGVRFNPPDFRHLGRDLAVAIEAAMTSGVPSE